MLDADVQQYLDEMKAAGGKPIEAMSVAQARRQMIVGIVTLGNQSPVARTEEFNVPVEDGQIAVRVYHPTDEDHLPIVVYFHGGGFVLGNIDTHDGVCRELALRANAIVVSVDYRLAPEFKFPTAVTDSYSALCWVAENAERLRGDRTRLAVCGDSAGGNLAAVMALMTRDRSGPELCGQLLTYPITDSDLTTESYREKGEGFGLSRGMMKWFLDHYIRDERDLSNMLLRPMIAESLHDLPPALVVTAEYDPLLDEGEAYAHRLEQNGVEVELRRYDGLIHGFTRRFRLFQKANDALDDMAGWLAQRLGTSPK